MSCLAPACADETEPPCAAVPACGETGLEPIAAPASAADERFNLVLQSLEDELYVGVGRYIDGTLLAYEGTATFSLTVWYTEDSPYYTDGSPLQRVAASGTVVALLVETEQELQPGGRWPLTTLHLRAVEDEVDTYIAEDHREPGVPFRGNISSAYTCTGTMTSFIEAPEALRLDRIVCEEVDESLRLLRRLEIDADLRRMDPSTIDYADAVNLRNVPGVGPPPELGHEDRCTPAVVQEHVGARRVQGSDECYVEIDYEAVTFVRKDCVASHGVAELEVGAARRCCCTAGHCHPSDYVCVSL